MQCASCTGAFFRQFLTSFSGDEFFQRVVHRLVTDFIVQMPSKLKDLRNRADENARILLMCLQEGREPPPTVAAAGKEFQSFLQLIGEFYSQDPLNLELCLEFWCPSQGKLGALGDICLIRFISRDHVVLIFNMVFNVFGNF